MVAEKVVGGEPPPKAGMNVPCAVPAGQDVGAPPPLGKIWQLTPEAIKPGGKESVNGTLSTPRKDVSLLPFLISILNCTVPPIAIEDATGIRRCFFMLMFWQVNSLTPSFC